MSIVTNSFNQHRPESTLSNKTGLEEIKAKLFSFLNKVSQRIVTAINSADELRVWQSHNREGHTIWHGYNPNTGRSVWVDSEAEIRAWIEEQYYQY